MDGRSWQETRTLPPLPAPSIPCHLLPGCCLPFLSSLPPSLALLWLHLSFSTFLPCPTNAKILPAYEIPAYISQGVIPSGSWTFCDERVQTPVQVIGRPGIRMGFPQKIQWLHLCCEQRQRLDKGSSTELIDACSPGTHVWEEGNVRVGVCG